MKKTFCIIALLMTTVSIITACTAMRNSSDRFNNKNEAPPLTIEVPEYIPLPKDTLPMHINIVTAAVIYKMRKVEVKHARVIQARLGKLGFYQSKVDGLWGKGSQRSLKAFKNANGMSDPLKWNNETQMALFEGWRE